MGMEVHPVLPWLQLYNSLETLLKAWSPSAQNHSIVLTSRLNVMLMMKLDYEMNFNMDYLTTAITTILITNVKT